MSPIATVAQACQVEAKTTASFSEKVRVSTPDGTIVDGPSYTAGATGYEIRSADLTFHWNERTLAWEVDLEAIVRVREIERDTATQFRSAMWRGRTMTTALASIIDQARPKWTPELVRHYA